MTRLTPILLGLTFVIAVAALVLALWPVGAEAPWDDGITEAELEAELSEILQAAQETSSEEKEPSSEAKEAERVAKCESISNLLLHDKGPAIAAEAFSQVIAIVLENNCVLDWQSP